MKLKALAAVICMALPLQAQAQLSEDEEGVRRAVLNYVEGFYEGDSTKIVMGVYPEVNKRGFYIPRNSDSDKNSSTAPFIPSSNWFS